MKILPLSIIPKSKYVVIKQHCDYIRDPETGKYFKKLRNNGHVVYYNDEGYTKTYTSPTLSIEHCIKLARRRIKKMAKKGYK